MLSVLCKVLLCVAIFGEYASLSSFSAAPFLTIFPLLLIFEFLFLIFAFPKNLKGLKLTSLFIAATDVLYAASLLICSAVIYNAVVLAVLRLIDALIWLAITLKFFGKPIKIFEKAKLLYIILPLVKPLAYFFILHDFAGTVGWFIVACVFALIGGRAGYNKIKTDYSEQEHIEHQKNCLAGFLLIAFYPVGVFYMWKNKCYGRLASRIIRTVLAAFWFVLYSMLIIKSVRGCPHKWIEGSCFTAPRCEYCGQVADEPRGHVEIDWVAWDADYDNGKDIRQKVCLDCGEVFDTQTKAIESFVDGDVFTIHSNSFASRFEKQSSCALKREYDYSKFYFVEDNAVHYIVKDGAGSELAVITFNTPDKKALPVMNDYIDNSIGEIVIQIKQSSAVSSVTEAAVLAIEPQISGFDASELAKQIAEGGSDGVSHNGIKYRLRREDGSYYLQISPQK